MVFSRKVNTKVAVVTVVSLFLPLSTTAFSRHHIPTSTILRRPSWSCPRHCHSHRASRNPTTHPTTHHGSIDGTIFEPLGVGVKRDFGARFPLYASDIKDGLNAQTLATTLFLFFACLAPAIGFGGTLGAATGGAMGAIEMVTSTAFCGVVYALCAPQPIQL
jgi:hypothetical protein